VVITLLALAPMVLPGDRPLDSLPAPLRGTAQAGEIVAEALAPTDPEESPEAAPTGPQQTPPGSPTAASNGILGDTASGSGDGSSGSDPGRSGGGSTPGRPGGAPPPPPPPPPPPE
jgi:WAS/WASL-interacting protein